jgi:hypothetical protein
MKMVEEKVMTALRDLLRKDKEIQRLYSEAFLHGLREDKSLNYAAIAGELFAVAQERKLAGLESAAQIQELLELQAKQVQERGVKKPEEVASDYYTHVSRVTLYNTAAVVTALEIWKPDPINGSKIYDSGDITVWYKNSIYLCSLIANGKLQDGDIFMPVVAIRGGNDQYPKKMTCDITSRTEAYFTLSGDLCDGPHLRFEERSNNSVGLGEGGSTVRKDPTD